MRPRLLWMVLFVVCAGMAASGLACVSVLGDFDTAVNGTTTDDAGADAAPGSDGATQGDTAPPAPFAVTVTKAGKGTGTVTSAPAGIACGATCTASFAAGASVTLTAAPTTGSTFTGWSGGSCTGTATCVVSAAATLTATFALTAETLTVVKAGQGSGTVTSAPAGILCGATCAAGFDPGTAVTLTAAPGKSSIFAGWAGACTGTGPCAVTLSAATSVTATFTAIIPTTWDINWNTVGATFTNGALSVSGNSASTKNVRTLSGKRSGKWYWELTATGGDGATDAGGIGLVDSAFPATSAYLGSSASSFGFGYGGAQYYTSWAGTTVGAPPAANSAIKTGIVYRFALDMDAGKFWVGQDGAWYGAGDPVTGLNPALSGITGTVYPGITLYPNSIDAFTANFGASAFTDAVPAGFNAGVYDIPTTWDPAWSVAGVTYTNANLSISGNTVLTKNVRTLVGRATGKFYWEITTTGGDGVTNLGGLGVAESVMPNNAPYVGAVASGLSFGYANSPQYYYSWAGVKVTGTPPVSSYVKTGNVYMFALDMVGGNLWMGQNGTWYQGDPVARTLPPATLLTGTVYPAVTFYPNSTNAFTANFGASAFTYTAPAGFSPGFF